MRFFELLQRVRFEDMVPMLKEFCISDRQPVGQLAYYKQAFDCLRLMKPEINNGTIRVGTSDGDGDFWARGLGKTIVYNDGLPSDDAVVAAHFLWNCTFYGFTPVTGYNSHSDEENPYWMKSFHILEKDMVFAAHLSLKRFHKIDIFERDETEAFDKLYSPHCKMNRSKRMRLHRHEVMKERYDRMAKVLGTIDEICSLDADIKRDDLNYLYDTAQIHNDRFESHTEVNKSYKISPFRLFCQRERTCIWELLRFMGEILLFRCLETYMYRRLSHIRTPDMVRGVKHVGLMDGKRNWLLVKS